MVADAVGRLPLAVAVAVPWRPLGYLGKYVSGLIDPLHVISFVFTMRGDHVVHRTPHARCRAV
jgi:hypothetical protein